MVCKPSPLLLRPRPDLGVFSFGIACLGLRNCTFGSSGCSGGLGVSDRDRGELVEKLETDKGGGCRVTQGGEVERAFGRATR